MTNNFTSTHRSMQGNYISSPIFFRKLKLLCQNWHMNSSGTNWCKTDYLTFSKMNPVHHFYMLTSGTYKGHVICLWCTALLKAHLAFHNCLLYPNIAEWHIRAVSSTKNCPFPACCSISYSLKDYLMHILQWHGTLILFTCPDCGVGYMCKNSVQLHQRSVSYDCGQM